MPEIKNHAVQIIDKELAAAVQEAWMLSAHHGMAQHPGMRRLMGHLYRLGLAIEQVKAPMAVVGAGALEAVDLSDLMRRGGNVIFEEKRPETGPGSPIPPQKAEVRVTGERPVYTPSMDGLRGLRMPSAAHELDRDLEDVLDSYRLAGRRVGAQVVGVDEVVCWIGDIAEDLTAPQTLPWGYRSAPCVYHVTRGANALEDATKWLRSQLP